MPPVKRVAAAKRKVDQTSLTTNGDSSVQATAAGGANKKQRSSKEVVTQPNDLSSDELEHRQANVAAARPRREAAVATTNTKAKAKPAPPPLASSAQSAPSSSSSSAAAASARNLPSRQTVQTVSAAPRSLEAVGPAPAIVEREDSNRYTPLVRYCGSVLFVLLFIRALSGGFLKSHLSPQPRPSHRAELDPPVIAAATVPLKALPKLMAVRPKQSAVSEGGKDRAAAATASAAAAAAAAATALEKQAAEERTRVAAEKQEKLAKERAAAKEAAAAAAALEESLAKAAAAAAAKEAQAVKEAQAAKEAAAVKDAALAAAAAAAAAAKQKALEIEEKKKAKAAAVLSQVHPDKQISPTVVRFLPGTRVTFADPSSLSLFSTASSSSSFDALLRKDLAGKWTGSRVISATAGRARDIQLTSPPLKASKAGLLSPFLSMVGEVVADGPSVVNNLFNISRLPARGSCYCFYGTNGSLSINLYASANVHRITLFHRQDDYSTAPLHFQLLGWPEDPTRSSWGMRRPKAPKVLGAFGSLPSSSLSSSSSASAASSWELQSFDVAVGKRRDLGYRAITLQVLSNHGDTHKTCLYRMQVFGDLVAPPLLVTKA